ncbi:MAG: glycosyltransferase family 39 protein [Chloroflexi bacterium]|nr:glycosyltransferase family 39 protein [Chloroflexota bacterium]
MGNAQRNVMGTPPLDYLITTLVRTLGESEFVLRFPAVVWGVLGIALTFVLARRVTGSRGIAYSAALLFACAPLLVHFAQEARFYSLPICLSLLVVYVFGRAWQQPRAWRWALFGLATLIALFPHYYTLLVIGALVLGGIIASLPFFTDRARDLPRAWSSLAVALLVPGIALVLWMMGQGFTGPGEFGFAPPTLFDVIAAPVTSGYRESPFHLVTMQVLGIVVLPFLAVIGLGDSLRARRSSGVLLALIVGIGAAGVLFADWRAQYFYTARQLLFVVPFYLILVAAGLDVLMRVVLRRSTWAAAGTIVALGLMLAVFALSLQRYYDVPKDDWRSAARLIASAASRTPNTYLSAPNGLEQYLTFYESSLAPHRIAEEQLPPRIEEARVWVVNWGNDTPRVVETLKQGARWRVLPLAVSPNLYLWYAGAAKEEQLWRELAALDLPPQVLAYSNVLPPMQAIDARLAQQVTQRSIALMQTMRPPLLDVPKARFWRRIQRMPTGE